MNTSSFIRLQHLAWACAGLALASLIAACGGAIGSGGTGATAPAVSGGTVTGFGSVIIDGLRFDDRGLATLAESEPDNPQPAESHIGQRVEVEVDNGGAARSLRIEASVVGIVTSTSVTGPQAGSLVVLGQTVIINADAAAGPVTQFGRGLANALDLRSGDPVEVHGAGKPSGGTTVIQATRIEKLPAPPAHLRVSGLVAALGVGGPSRFTLGALEVDFGSAALSPAGTSLRNGVPVLVFAPAANLGVAAGGGPSLVATTVRAKKLRADGSETVASGFIANLDNTAGRFELNGLTVTFTPEVVEPKGITLANGLYVRARGTLAADGSLAATQVKRRDGSGEPEAELKGNITGFNAATGSFLIRNVNATLTGTTRFEDCPATGLRDGLFVELEGTLGPTGVLAKKVACKDEPGDAVIERKGPASAVDLAASSFTLTPTGKPPLTVIWSALTYFGDNLTPQSLEGKTLEVEGRLVSGDLQANKIKLND